VPFSLRAIGNGVVSCRELSVDVPHYLAATRSARPRLTSELHLLGGGHDLNPATLGHKPVDRALAQRSISERNQSLHLPRPMSTTGLGIEEYRFWYTETDVRCASPSISATASASIRFAGSTLLAIGAV
jgi:hypothetical protein